MAIIGREAGGNSLTEAEILCNIGEANLARFQAPLN